MDVRFSSVIGDPPVARSGGSFAAMRLLPDSEVHITAEIVGTTLPDQSFGPAPRGCSGCDEPTITQRKAKA